MYLEELLRGLQSDSISDYLEEMFTEFTKPTDMDVCAL